MENFLQTCLCQKMRTFSLKGLLTDRRFSHSMSSLVDLRVLGEGREL